MSNKRVSEIVDAAKNLNWIDNDQVNEIHEIMASETVSDPDTLLVDKGFLSKTQLESLQRTSHLNEGENLYGRFQVTGSHAQGGLGEVFKAEDQELRREVALKQLKNRFVGNQELRQRFMMEAELTGSLEHPGIVPVYGLGVGDDGVPYYAMRFIRGESMRDAVNDFHKKKASQDISSRVIAFRKLLSNFQSVCQTMYFAHSRGILHRDIKPDNIMLGEFGETMIVDWGIAKVIGRVAPELLAEVETIVPKATSGPQTRQGSVIGTPGFMSPEQSLGWNDNLTPASDVYSLGATMFYLLTGSYPFAKDSTIEQIIASTCSGKISTPIEFDKTVSKPLNAICCKAMATKTSQRYGSAKQMADDIEAYLADEPITAWQEPFLARVSRVARRYRTAVTMAGLGLLVVTAVSVVSSILINQQRSIAERNRKQAELLAEEKQEIATLEIAARAEADQKRQEAESSLDFLVRTFRSPDPERNGRNIKVVEVLDRAVAEIPERLKDNPLQQATLLYSIGETYLGLGIFDNVLNVAKDAHEIRVRELGPEHLETSDTWSLLGLVYTELDQHEKAIEHHQRSLEIRKQHHGDTHLDVLITQNNIANALLLMGKEADAVELYEHSYRHLKEQFGEENFNTLLVMSNLTVLYRGQGKLEEALAMGEKVLDIRTKKFGQDSFGTMLAGSNLVDVYEELGQTDKSRELARDVFENQTKNLGGGHPETIRSAIRWADALSDNGDPAGAIEILETTIEHIVERYGKEHVVYFQAHDTLAIANVRVGNVDRASEIYADVSRGARDHLGDDHPTTFTILTNSAVTLSRAGKYRESADTMEELVKIGSTFMESNHPRLLILKNNLAYQRLSHGKIVESTELFRECLEGWQEFGSVARPAAISAEGLCHALLTGKEFELLEIAATDAIEMAENFTESDPAMPARNRSMLAVSLAQQGKLDQAEMEIAKVISFYESNKFNASLMAYSQCVLALIKVRQEKLDEAKEVFDQYFGDLEDENESAPRYYWYQLLHAFEYQIELYKALELPDEADRLQTELELTEMSYSDIK